MPNITEKLTRLRGLVSTFLVPSTMVGPRKNVPPKPSRNWLTYRFCGRVRLLEKLSITDPVAISAREITSGISKCAGLMVKALTTSPAIAPASITTYSVCICW
ncbi:hypothetical protein PS663_05779 [Pseudomonas fluorescens]|nr:hypothetical protein PS663_05779 [Pseudomonas fluorescens]